MTEPRPDARASGDPDVPDTPADTSAAGPAATTGDADPRVERTRTLALNEDWAATLVGLVILAVVLVGLWPDWLVP